MERSGVAVFAIVFFGLLLLLNITFKVSPPNNKSIIIFIFVFVVLYLVQKRKELKQKESRR